MYRWLWRSKTENPTDSSVISDFSIHEGLNLFQIIPIHYCLHPWFFLRLELIIKRTVGRLQFRL